MGQTETFDSMATAEYRDVEKAAIDFADKRDAWQAKHQPMMDAKAVLLSKMHEHEIDTYKLSDGRIVAISASENVSVRKPKDAEE